MKPLIKEPFLQRLEDPLFQEKGVAVHVLRLDVIHPRISGNKWFKLKYNLEEFFRLRKKILVTMGGAYSNHIQAVAAAGKENGISTAGIIRGEELNFNSNAMLKFAASCGMKLIFVSREVYRQLRNDESIAKLKLDELQIPDDDVYFLPEGGSNSLAAKGAMEILQTIPIDFDFVCCAAGTGATLAGISMGLKESQDAIGIPVLKESGFLWDSILNLNGNRENFKLFHDYSFGGYACSTPALDSFCENFFARHNIRIEPVYTGKLFYGLNDLISKDYFQQGAALIAVHTGGVHDLSSLLAPA